MCCGSKKRSSSPKTVITRSVPKLPIQKAMPTPKIKPIITPVKKCSCGWPMHRFAKRENSRLVFYLMCLNRQCRKQELL